MFQNFGIGIAKYSETTVCVLYHQTNDMLKNILLVGLGFCMATTTLSGASSSERSRKTIDYKAIDKYALETPKSAEKSPERLAAYLMRAASSDIEKARAVVRWITTNIEYETDPELLADPASAFALRHADSAFRHRRAIDAGFANLFVRMMKSVGLEAVVIAGLHKGLTSISGDTSTMRRRVWNAFKTRKGEWMLVDLPIYTEEENSDGDYRTKYADAFFCIPPEQLIYSHYPDSSRWQLLAEPISKEQFVHGVQYFGAYYACSLKILSHQNYAIKTRTKTLTMEFDIPSNQNIGARLYRSSCGYAAEVRSAIRWRRHGSTLALTVTIPADGAYRLELTTSQHIVSSDLQKNFIGCAVKTVAEYGITLNTKTKYLASR